MPDPADPPETHSAYAAFCLTVVRHGETEANQAKLIQGQAGGKLTARGVLQAERLGKRLSTTRFAEVHCSDLHRTQQTLDGIRVSQKLKNVPIHLTDLIREKAAGDYEGKGIGAQEADAKAQNVSIRVFRPKGGECWDDVLVRARTFVAMLVEKHCTPIKPQAGSVVAPAPGPQGRDPAGISAALGGMRLSAPAPPPEPNILVVTHGGFIKELLNVLMKRTGTTAAPYFLNNTRNTGVYVLRVTRTGPGLDFAATMTVCNDASHLKD